jgi:hypothetical protein
MLDMVMPFIVGPGRARDGKDDELIDRARQCAFELQEEPELLNAACELWMVEQREIRAPKPSPLVLRRADIFS